MSKAFCIFVAYSESQMRRTLKPFKSVLFTVVSSFGIFQCEHELLILWFCSAGISIFEIKKKVKCNIIYL